MCGICGFINHNYPIEILHKMNETLSHRGPDDEGYYYDKHIALAHKRLSILDLSALGRQPMWDNEQIICVTFNGEIFNFKEIRAELISDGYNFSTETDTEVIIHAYKKWGIKGIEKFIGMFAIALWDVKEQKLSLIRDRLGIKPLYYYLSGNDLVFGSELKAIIEHPSVKKEININAVKLYLSLGYIPAPYSIYKDTFKLEPGTYLQYNGNGFEKKVYWNIVDIKNNIPKASTLSEKDYFDQLESLLMDSIKKRMISDVPIGAFISGGIDSTTVVALMSKVSKQKVKTFTIGFEDENYNEAQYAKEIAHYIGTDHTELYFNKTDLFDLVEELPKYYDEPFYDSSALPTMLVSKLAKDKVTVALSGDGGDELFCGYKTYDYLNAMAKTNKLPYELRKTIGKLGAFYNPKLAEVLDYKIDISELSYNLKAHFSDAKIESLLKANTSVSGKDFFRGIYNGLDGFTVLEKDMITDIKYYMVDDILTKVDRASMKYGLEVRVPMLDHRIVEFSQSVPIALKRKGKVNKYILKELTKRHIPEELTNRPKKGFSVPVKNWVQESLRKELEYYLSEDFICKQNIFNFNSLFELYKQNKLTAEQKWLLYVFQKWYAYYLC